jgi:mRNA-degrading endonuclease RelE of RelBE toxin-antitoxin system
VFHIDVDKPTADFLRHLHPLQKQKMRASLDVIAQDPSVGKVLRKELAGLFSYRVGRYRIIYAVNLVRKEVNIIAIGPRDSIYEALETQRKRPS